VYKSYDLYESALQQPAVLPHQQVGPALEFHLIHRPCVLEVLHILLVSLLVLLPDSQLDAVSLLAVLRVFPQPLQYVNEVVLLLLQSVDS